MIRPGRGSIAGLSLRWWRMSQPRWVLFSQGWCRCCSYSVSTSARNIMRRYGGLRLRLVSSYVPLFISTLSPTTNDINLAPHLHLLVPLAHGHVHRGAPQQRAQHDPPLPPGHKALLAAPPRLRSRLVHLQLHRLPLRPLQLLHLRLRQRRRLPRQVVRLGHADQLLLPAGRFYWRVFV